MSGYEPPAPDGSALGALGLSDGEERVYRQVLRRAGQDVAALADATGLDDTEVAGALATLVRLGLVADGPDGVRARPPREAVDRLLAERRRSWTAHGVRLDSLRDEVLPALEAEHLASSLPGSERISLELVDGGDVSVLLQSLALTSSGELLWMRPDQWRRPFGPDIDAWVQDALRAGRPSRALYPARVLEEAPQVLWDRAEAGEHVRILADVPSRLAVLGDDVAVVDERPGGPGDRRLVVRQPALVTMMRLTFDTLWEKAMAVPGLDGHQRHHDSLERGVLLDLLSDGAKDEQISRELALSLRTVRRRVAELLEDLGAGSRFQAGVEAVRRGWV